MSMTPLDIQQKRFPTAWRGLDKAEVDRFLHLAASEFEALIREVNELREEQSRTKRLLDEYQARDEAIKETMITAQRVTEEITDNAKKEADIIMGRAELEAEKLLEGAQARLTELLRDIGEAKRQRVQLLSELSGVLETHQKLIALARAEEDAAPKVEENLAVMRRVAPPPPALDARVDLKKAPGR